MTEAVDVLHAVEQLLALAKRGPGADAAASHQVNVVLVRLGLGKVSSAYTAEKLAAVRDSFDAWFSARQWAAMGEDPGVFRHHLLHEIEHLKKALARGAAGQD
jgi:hypothetical protein